MRFAFGQEFGQDFGADGGLLDEGQNAAFVRVDALLVLVGFDEANGGGHGLR